MPNYCDNRATIKHNDLNKLKELRKQFKKGNFFNSIIPIGDDKDWYGFCVSNWGTKWETVDGTSTLKAKEKTLYLDFLTAWSPPSGIYNKLTELGYHVEAYYDEGGVGFCGKYDSIEGESAYAYDDEIPDDIDFLFEITERLEEIRAENEELSRLEGVCLIY